MKNFVAKILFLLFLGSPTATMAQYQYLFDNQSQKVKRSIKNDVEMLKQNVEYYKAQKQINKDNWKSSRQTISHTYKIQTRKTRKRMMASRCKASHFNGDNTLFCSTLHKLYKHGQVYRFFGLSDSDCNFYNNRVGGEIKQAKQEQHPTRF